MKLISERVESAQGGKGYLIKKNILGKKELDGKCSLYAEMSLAVNSSIGYHEHHGESETYYILSGKGDYNDNGTIRTVKAGDATFTARGCGHGLENTGNVDLVFIALIILV